MLVIVKKYIKYLKESRLRPMSTPQFGKLLILKLYILESCHHVTSELPNSTIFVIVEWVSALIDIFLCTLGCPIFHFFLIELHPCNHACSWVVWVHKKNFSVIDQKLTFGERFLFLHFLQEKKGQNKPENPQNWNMAKIAPKSDKFTKSKP